MTKRIIQTCDFSREGPDDDPRREREPRTATTA